MSNKTVYLAGPIGGLSYEKSTDWRLEVISKMKELDSEVKCFDPMRAKQFLAQRRVMSKATIEDAEPLATSRGIMRRDFFDCKRAAVLFVNLLPCKEKSVGTIMEVAWAYMLHKPIIIVGRKDDAHVVHPMFSEALAYRVGSLNEGIALLHAVLGEG